MSEFEDLTKTLVYVVTLFILFVIAYNIYLYMLDHLVLVEEPILVVNENFDMASFKSSNRKSLDASIRTNLKSKKESARMDKKKSEKKDMPRDSSTNSSFGQPIQSFQGNNPDCITQAQCQIQQTANDNSKTLNKLTEKVDQLSQTVTSVQNQFISSKKKQGVKGAKSAVSSIPNTPALTRAKGNAMNNVNNNS